LGRGQPGGRAAACPAECRVSPKRVVPSTSMVKAQARPLTGVSSGCRTARHSRALVEQLLGTLRLNHPRTSVNGRRILTPCRHRRSVLRRWLESAPAATGSVFTCRRHSCPWTDPGKSTSREGQAVHESHGHEADDFHPARPAPDRPPPTLAGGSVRIRVVQRNWCRAPPVWVGISPAKG